MRTRIIAGIGLALAVLAPLVPPADAANAAPESNIPGVPLPGQVVTGSLGGPIVDVVYRVEVPPKRVLALSLTGSPGTDYDIYLFDSTATDVYANPLVGLVAKAVGPTSTESLRYSTITGGLFYIDLSSSDVAGQFRLTVGLGADVTPPKVSLAIDGGAPATNARAASVSVIATDDLSGVANMQLSADGTTWGAWEPWQSITDWTLADRDGPQTVWARVSDNQGNLSAVASATITLDRVAPAVLARYPEPNGIVAAPRPTLWAQFSERIRVATWQAFGLVVQDTAGTTIYGTYGWNAATNTGTFTPSSDLLAGATYLVSFGSLQDIAGNSLPPLGTWTMRPVVAPRISLTAKPRATAPATTVLLSGVVDSSYGGSFVLQHQATDGAWLDLEPLLPDPKGAFYSTQVVKQNSVFRVAYSGDDASAATTSPSVRILVRRSVTLAGPASSTVRSAASGARIAVTALLVPAAPSTSVTIRLYRYDVGTRAYRQIATFARPSASGKAVFAWRALTPGTYAVQVSTPATTLFAAGTSPLYRWIIR